ncbi:MAG: hypothetical protein PHH61_04260 [Candidatus Nanoarchaeia archaeon]|nr:hypothetical protein [Candidatus Nanoarchaeia archaeon]
MKIITSKTFGKQINKLDNSERERAWKIIKNIIDGKVRGKPLKYDRKGTMEVYMGSKRLYSKVEDNTLYLLEISHKNQQ